jgi:formate hydrogenlyase subunit 3/multisubunit Na+/H+ antiporter MnhD subunit
MVAGITAAFYGVVVGLTQSHPKSILAYSSVSQMGLMTVALGVALAVPSARPLALSAIMVYATHHALAKGALFLGVGVADHVSTSRQRLLVGVGLLLAALALAGAPLSSGAVAKTFLKDATYVVSDPWSERLSLLLQLGAVATTLLMGRFLLAVWPDTRKPAHDLSAGLWLPWSVAVALVAGWVFLLPEELATVAAKTLAFSSLWPVTVGALLVGGGWWLYRRPGMRFRPAIPEGDVLLLVIRLLHALRAGWRTYIMPSWNTVTHRTERSQQRGDVTATLAYLEGRLNAWLVAGTIFMVLVTLALVLVVLV